MAIKIEEHETIETSYRHSNGTSYSIERHDYIKGGNYDGEVNAISDYLEDKACGIINVMAKMHGWLDFYELSVVRSPEGDTVFYIEMLGKDDTWKIHSISISVV